MPRSWSDLLLAALAVAVPAAAQFHCKGAHRNGELLDVVWGSWEERGYEWFAGL